ncbi:MAG: hypothetical protein AB8H86_31440 [Polyangiales bacterium]
MRAFVLGFVLSACGAASHPGEGPVDGPTEPATENGTTESTHESAEDESAEDESAGRLAPEPENAELAQLVATLDENPDMLHSDYTPSVHALSTHGVPAARAVVHLLDAEAPYTRLHAQRVVEGVVNHTFGFRSGSGFPDAELEAEARRWIAEWGYAYDGARDERREATARVAASLDELVSLPR